MIVKQVSSTGSPNNISRLHGASLLLKPLDFARGVVGNVPDRILKLGIPLSLERIHSIPRGLGCPGLARHLFVPGFSSGEVGKERGQRLGSERET